MAASPATIPPITLPTPAPTPAGAPPTSQLPISFRPAIPADAPRLVTLVRSAYRGDESRQGWTTEADLLDDQRIDDAEMLKKITNQNQVVLLAFRKEGNDTNEEGTLIACCELYRKDAVAYFGMFAVSPKLQAGGVGRRVLERAERWAKEEWGMGMIEMNVIWTRDELIGWYERRGYRRTERTEPFPYAEMIGGKNSREDLYFIVMEKEL